MTWPAKFKANFIAPIAANLLQRVEEDQAAALEWANGSPLKSFKKIYNSGVGRAKADNFPLFMLDSAGTTEIPADGTRIGLAHTLSFELAIAGSNPDVLTDEIYVYVRAVDSIWRTMTPAQLTNGMTSEVVAARVTKIDHSYDPLRGGSGAYLRVATMDVRVEIFER